MNGFVQAIVVIFLLSMPATMLLMSVVRLITAIDRKRKRDRMNQWLAD